MFAIFKNFNLLCDVPVMLRTFCFTGNKGQFIFNSELCGTLDEVSDLLAAKQTEKAEEQRTNRTVRPSLSSLITSIEFL